MRALSLVLAISLTACATTPSTHLNEGKALADAWSAFDSASITLDSLQRSGVLNPTEKNIIRNDGPRIRDALNAATSAYASDNDATASQNVTAAATLIADLIVIVKAHPK